MLIGLLCISISSLSNLMLPTMMTEILNNGVYNADMAYIVKCCVIMLVIAAVGLAAVLLGTKISCDVVAGYCADLRSAVFKKVNTMTFEEFGSIGTAALVTRATHDVGTVSWIASEFSGAFIMIPVLFIGGAVLSMLKDAALALTLLAFVPAIFVFVILMGKRIVPLWRKSDSYIDRQNDIMRERMRGIRVIRAFNAETREHERIAGATEIMADNIIRANTTMQLISPVATFLLNCALVLIVWLGGVRIETGAGTLTGADVFAIVQYVTLITNSIVMAAFAIIMLPHVKVASGRINEVLSAKGTDMENAEDDAPITGDIEFNTVSFSYDGAEKPAVSNVTLRIPAGSRAAIIGGTGSGKSTLVNLLLGFRRPTEGAVLFGGRDAAKISRAAVRRGISCVLQTSSIYSGTIRENICMGRPDASDEDIRRCLELSQAAEFVYSLPDGTEHRLEQAGRNLSGGQKQRLSIARALLKNAPIYIFDDSFSALDFLTESRLRSALAEHLAGCTQIIVTQRITSAMHSDVIFVLDEGKLIDSGRHSELLERCSVYREIYASQTGGDAE